MKKDNAEKDKFEKILDRFKKDGTHPEYPIQKVYHGEEFSKMAASNLTFDLPALVVYEQNEDDKTPHIGIVFALSSCINGVCIQVMSKYKGEVKCHPIEESPSGEQPAYLLMKKHYTMNNVP